MESIRQRFLQAEKDFLLAARSDNQALTDFAELWQTLWSDWESSLHGADHDTQQLVDRVVTKIEELAGDFYLLESRTLSLEDDLLNSLEEVFASLTLEEDTVVEAKTVSAVASATDRGAITPAQWLLHNLHNPYPLPHVQLSTGRSASSKHTKDWFSKARQRIGWTRLLRDRFAGCRSLATDAAFRAFVRDDPENPLDNDLKTAFLAIKSHAELVYGGEAATCQSSPKRSRSVSPTPSLTSSSSAEDTDEWCPTSPLQSDFKRPSKRTLDTSDFPSSKRRRTPSPDSPHSQPSDNAYTPTETHPTRPRKRRLSESHSDSPRPKRPRGVEGNRLQAVSDPLPAPTVPTWPNFDQTFQIPDPASTRPLDSNSFDLGFFNPEYLASCVVPSIPSPFNGLTAYADDISALFEMPKLDLLQSELPSFSSDWTQFLNFEPDLSLFPSSPSLLSSLASTPPLVDDAILSPPSPSNCGPSSPGPLLDILPHLSEKNIQLFTAEEPAVREQDFLLPPGEDPGIFSVSALLSIH